MEEEIPSKENENDNSSEEAEIPKRKRRMIEDSDFITEENIIKIKSILVYLENYNKPKNDIECLYSQINNCSIKERVVLDTLLTLFKSKQNSNRPKFLKYKDILENNDNEEKEEDEIDKKIFTAVDRVAHKTLHKEKDEKNNKICQIYKDLNDFEFKESDKSIGYNNIDKLINSLKEKQPYIEFIAIKTIFISIKNITQELINIYYKTSEEMNFNMNLNIINDENEIDEDEAEMIEINPKIFEILFNDYIFMSNRCSFLENYFIESFNNFRNKYKMDFTLSDLFTDIFWNGIFHNKALCKKFINIYIGNDKCDENIRKILSKIIKILNDKSIPLKSQITQFLSLNNIENEEIDLISSIITQKNINYDYIKNEKLITNVNYKALNPEEIIENKINNDNSNKEEPKIKEEKKEEIKEKEEQKFSEEEMENKTVDEIYNYINENTSNKTKKKKRNKKKKNKKNEKQIKFVNSIEENKIEDYDDEIINNFKEDIIKNMIDANKINKIKPFVSEKFLSIISQKY